MGSTILLADDSLTIQKVVELTFSDTDHEVVAVSSGEELMQRLPETRPDLVICDILMPGTDGYEVCQRIKSSPASLHIPVILLTGTFEPFDRDRALAAGCSEIITKPFEARKLVETVERLLAGDTSAPRASDRPGPAAVAAPNQFQVAVPPPATGQLGDGFETRLSPPDHAPTDAPSSDEGEGLEFTATGFAEMEAAGEAGAAPAPPPPDHGLEYEGGEAVAEDSGFEDAFGDEASGDGEFDDDTGGADEPFASNEVTADFPPPVATDDEPFADEAAAAEPPPPEAPAVEPPPFDDDAMTSSDTWPDMTETAGDVGDAFDQVDVSAEAEPEVAATPPPTADGPGEDASQDHPGHAHDDDVDDGADTAPIVEPPPPPPEVVPAPAEAVAAAAAGAALSDEDVDRIARRLLELAADRIEQIAWDVVPDMAEIVVRERIRELESAADADA